MYHALWVLVSVYCWQFSHQPKVAGGRLLDFGAWVGQRFTTSGQVFISLHYCLVEFSFVYIIAVLHSIFQSFTNTSFCLFVINQLLFHFRIFTELSSLEYIFYSTHLQVKVKLKLQAQRLLFFKVFHPHNFVVVLRRLRHKFG